MTNYYILELLEIPIIFIISNNILDNSINSSIYYISEEVP